MYRARDIAVDPTVRRGEPFDSGIDGDELGCAYGAPDTPVKGLPVIESLHSGS